MAKTIEDESLLFLSALMSHGKKRRRRSLISNPTGGGVGRRGSESASISSFLFCISHPFLSRIIIRGNNEGRRGKKRSFSHRRLLPSYYEYGFGGMSFLCSAQPFSLLHVSHQEEDSPFVFARRILSLVRNRYSVPEYLLPGVFFFFPCMPSGQKICFCEC